MADKINPKDILKAAKAMDLADNADKILKTLDKDGNGITDELMEGAKKAGMEDAAKQAINALDKDKDGDITDELKDGLKMLKKTGLL